MVLVFLRKEVLLLCYRGELCVFTLALLFPLLGQRLGQEPERDAGQQHHSASRYEAQPPGSYPAGVLVVDGNGFWERETSKTLDYL